MKPCVTDIYLHIGPSSIEPYGLTYLPRSYKKSLDSDRKRDFKTNNSMSFNFHQKSWLTNEKKFNITQRKQIFNLYICRYSLVIKGNLEYSVTGFKAVL